MKRVPRELLRREGNAILLLGCGAGSVLGGVMFVAWGYIDSPNIPEQLRAVNHLLSLVVPALFLTAMVGLATLWQSRLGVLGWTGVALSAYAFGWGEVVAIVGDDEVWAEFAQRGWPHYLSDWLLFMLAGLWFMGLSALETRVSRRSGVVELAMGVFGWVYYVTDSGAILEARLVHVGFGLLFSLGWVVLGTRLLMAGTQRAKRPRAQG